MTISVAFPINYSNWPMVKVYNTDFRKDLLNMAFTITTLSLWDWVKENPREEQGFMFWEHENINEINKILPDNGHSGATFAYALRCMQFISKNGFDKFEKQFS